MENITDVKRKRLERNAKIKRAYEAQIKQDGAMKTQVVNSIAKFYKITPVTVYYILNGRKPPNKK